MNTAQIPKQLLSLAGEHRVVSELCKLGIFATLTPGNHKQTDLYAINDATKRFVRIEVKTSQTKKFVTGIGQRKQGNEPDIWVLVSFNQGRERFFVLENAEIEKLQQMRNAQWQERFSARNPGKVFDPSDGVDNLPLGDVETTDCENRWDKITAAVGTSIKQMPM